MYVLTVDVHTLCAFIDDDLVTCFVLDFEFDFVTECDCRWLCSIIWWIRSNCCFVKPSLLPPFAA